MEASIILIVLVWIAVGAVSWGYINKITDYRHSREQSLFWGAVSGPLELLDLLTRLSKPDMPERIGVVGLKPVCAKCRQELEVYGGLVFSPPDNDLVTKYHVCVTCWEKFVKWTKRK